MRVSLSLPGSARWTFGLLGLLAALANAGLAAAQTNPPSPAALKHYTKEPLFHLPIKFDEKSRNNILKVQLYIKTAGGDWQMRDEAPPTQKAFTFKAPADGEFWFTLVTFDFRGERTPQNLNRLTADDIVMVVVDTQAPTFELQPVKTPNGEVLLRCVVMDANPDYKAIRVAYRGADLAMHNLEQVPGQQGAFRVTGPEILNDLLRVTVTDLALNTTTKEVNLKEAVATLWPGSQKVPVLPIIPPIPSSPPSLPPASNMAGNTGISTVAQSFTPPSTPVVVPSPDNRLPQTMPAAPSAVQQTTGPIQQTANPIQQTTGPIQQTASPIHQTTSPVQPSTSPVQQTTMQRQLIGTTRASLEYRIDQIGPSGVGKVEIWVTSDQGASWKFLCEDTNRRSPTEFNLPGDGLYGIRVVVTNGNGFGGKPPIAGEQPQLWMEVDTTAPVVQLRELEPNANTGTIDIRWTATDKNLGAEPINLSFATRREGPWQPVARNLKNDGLYRWPIPRDMGAQFFIRVEATDLAGNVTRSESPTAVVLDMTEPRASVIGVTAVPVPPTPLRGN